MMFLLIQCFGVCACSIHLLGLKLCQVNILACYNGWNNASQWSTKTLPSIWGIYASSSIFSRCFAFLRELPQGPDRSLLLVESNRVKRFKNWAGSRGYLYVLQGNKMNWNSINMSTVKVRRNSYSSFANKHSLSQNKKPSHFLYFFSLQAAPLTLTL